MLIMCDRRYFFFALLFSLLTGCASSPANKAKGAVKSKNTATEISIKKTQGNMQPSDLLYILLRSEYVYWQGTPYRLGGDSLQGVDCSSLIKKVFKSSFNITLPRTTSLQVQKGYSIKKNHLQVGDLVFFKTGWKTRHVGIYMGENQFFHASTSKGVIISDLDNVYWNKHYWQSRRVIN